MQQACATGGPFAEALADAYRSRTLDTTLVWQPGDTERHRSAEARAAWVERREIDLAAGTAWRVPADPTWSEDPFDNATWRTRYHSLAWLMAPAEAFREGDAAAGVQVGRYVLDWIADNPPRGAPDERAWFDGSVWRRTGTLLAMWDVLVQVLEPSQIGTVLESLHTHGTKLRRYLSHPRFTAHNHNLFHSLVVMSLGTVRPEFFAAARWRSSGLARMGSVSREMVNAVDGVSTEQASAYHVLAMRLIAAADGHVRRLGMTPDPGIDPLLKGMTRFGALLVDPTGRLPAFGDTPYDESGDRMLAVLEDLAAQGLVGDEARYAVTRGAEGRRPPPATFYPGEGYAIFRPAYGDGGRPWADDLHVFFDMGRARRVHGHDDALNVLVTALGRPLVVDSGGPFKYRDPGRADFVAPEAHNTVVVPGFRHVPTDATVEVTRDDGRVSAAIGSHRGWQGVTHRRAVIVLEPDTVVILDRIIRQGRRAPRARLLYHFPPESQVAVTGRRTRVTVGDRVLDLVVRTGERSTTSVRSGAGEPSGGWVTPRIGVRSPAPVLDIAQPPGAGWFATVLRADRDGDPGIGMRVTRVGGKFTLDVQVEDRHATIVVRMGANPRIRVVAAP